MTVPLTPARPVPLTRDEGALVDAFTAGILQRIQHAESNLHRAREEGDVYTVDVEQADLDDLRRIAADHGVQVGTSA